MKILFVLQSINRIGGTEKATIDQANILAENTDHEIIILSLYKDVASNFYISRSVSPKIKVNYFFKNIVLLSKPDLFYRLFELIFKRRIAKEIDKFNADYIVYTSIKYFSPNKSNNILMVHFSYKYFLTGYVTKKLFEKYYKVFYKIIFLTNFDLMEYIEDKKNYNGVSISNFCLLEPNNRSTLNNKIITYVGRLDNYQKQLNKMIDIVHSLVINNEFDGWQLHIYGSGPDEKIIKKQIYENNLKNFIILKGSSNNLDFVYSKTDVLLLTSRFEGLPLCLIEASLSGIPLISFNCAPGIEILIKNNINGYVITQDDVSEFYYKLLSLLKSFELRKEFGENGLLYATEKFSIQSILNQWLELLDDS